METLITQSLPTATFHSGNPETMTRRLSYLDQSERGMIGAHPYRLEVVLHDVIMAGEGWSVRLPENPNAVPIVETFQGPEEGCPIFDPEFLSRVLGLVNQRARSVRAEISTDWSRRSTKPDQIGVVRHPLGSSESALWFCLSCDSKITGVQIAQNLWHCPGCGASPLDIFDSAFWCDDEGASLPSVEVTSVSKSTDIKFVDGRQKLDLNDDKIILLIRTALLEDASNVSERFAALQAEITVDDDKDVWIALEEDLWPEEKTPAQTLAVGALLGVELEFEVMWSKIPFAWPGLGKITSSTSEFTKMMLEAYAQRGGMAAKADE